VADPHLAGKSTLQIVKTKKAMRESHEVKNITRATTTAVSMMILMKSRKL
jgi:hypothetical protein